MPSLEMRRISHLLRLSLFATRNETELGLEFSHQKHNDFLKCLPTGWFALLILTMLAKSHHITLYLPSIAKPSLCLLDLILFKTSVPNHIFLRDKVIPNSFKSSFSLHVYSANHRAKLYHIVSQGLFTVGVVAHCH